MKKKILYISLIFLGLAMMVFSLFSIISSNKNTKIYEDIKEKNKVEEKNETIIDFDNLLKTNEEVIGWIEIPGTNIDYPVLKASSNEYYLDRNINKEKSKHGSIFMDYRNNGDGNDRHTIIYGHNMKDGTMFAELNKYKEKSFFLKNDLIIINTLEEEIHYEIFSAYVTDTNFYFILTDFRNDASFLSYINVFKGKSKFKKEITLSANDNILTLATCTYELDDARFVVQAKKIIKTD